MSLPLEPLVVNERPAIHFLSARGALSALSRAFRPSRVLALVLACFVLWRQHAGASPQVIEGLVTVPLTSTSTGQADVTAGMQELQSLNQTAHSGISAGLASGELAVVQLPPESRSMPKGAADSDTIAVYLGDDPDPMTIARRLEHEYFHWTQGEDGRLNPCEHMEVFTISYESAQRQSCLDPERPVVACSVFDELLAKITEFMVLCNANSSGPGLPFPDLLPPCVCRQ